MEPTGEAKVAKVAEVAGAEELRIRDETLDIACGYTPDVQVDPRDLRFTIPRNCAFLLDLVPAGELPADRLISAVVPWDCLAEVYARIAARERGFHTAVLRWPAAEAMVAASRSAAPEEVEHA